MLPVAAATAAAAMAPPAARVCAPTCDPGTLLGSSFARDVTLRPVAGNTVLSFGKCSLNWLDAKAVLTRFKRARHTWLLLVGDSDTRGMALALGEDSSAATALSRSLGDLSRRLAPPSTRVFGSVIGQRNRNAKFDAHSAPLLQRQGFVVLNRSTPLHARTSASGEQGIRASTGHAPHLINLVDWQRMLAAGVFDAVPIFKAAAACGGVSFAPWCVGRGKGDRHRFIEAFQHYCRAEKVSR